MPNAKAKGHEQRRKFDGEFSYDYVSLSVEEEISALMKSIVSETSQSQGEDKNAWRKEFTERLEFSILNKEIQERLKTTARAQQDWLSPCFRKANEETNSAIRRRCFCESIGPKFCAVCRRKVNKELSNRVPRIICDLRNSGKAGNRLELLERAEYFVTPEPKFYRQLKQASSFYKDGGYENSQGDQTHRNTPNTDEDQCLSIENLRSPPVSRSSSSSSLTSLKDPQFLSDVPSPPHNSLNISPVVPEFPIINSQKSSSVDIPNDTHILTTFPQLPAIANDPDILCDSEIFHITDQLRSIKELKTDLCSPDIPKQQNILVDIPQPPAITNETNIPSDPQIFHITHQLRSINELKADLRSPNTPSNPHTPQLIHQLPAIHDQEKKTNVSGNFSDLQIEKFSTSDNKSNLTKASVGTPDENSNSSKTELKMTQGDTIHTLPQLTYPVEPVQLELKYINFSIYDYDCK